MAPKGSRDGPSYSVLPLLKTIANEYLEMTPTQLKVIDLFLAFIMVTAVAQFTYCIVFGSFPFNAFLSGFLACVGTFVLTGAHMGGCHVSLALFLFSKKAVPHFVPSVALRMQLNLRDEFTHISKERAIGDFVVGEVVLFFFVFNFIG